MQVRPQHSPVNVLDHLQQVMMVAPVDAEKDKAKYVTEKHGSDRRQRLPGGVMRHLQFQNHDGDDDRNHPITECFQPAFTHLPTLSVYYRSSPGSEFNL